MGCETSKEKNEQKIKEFKAKIKLNSSSINQGTLSNRENRSFYQKKKKKIPLDYSLSSFQVMEKITENLSFKVFRVLDKNININQNMYVIPKQYDLDTDSLIDLSKFKDQNIININHIFTDDYYYYIITDYSCYNIFEGIFNFNSFGKDKLKRIIKLILKGFNYVFENNIPVFYFDYSKIKLINEYGEVKIEFFDIDEIIESESQEKLGIEPSSLMQYLAKILLILFDEKIEVKVDDFLNDDSILIYSLFKPDLYTHEESELIEYLINFGKEKITIEKILQLDYFMTPTNRTCLTLLKQNECLFNFYTRFYLIKCTLDFLKFGYYYKQNEGFFNDLFNSFDGLNNNEIKLIPLATNIREKMKKRYIAYEMMEIISFCSNMKISFFNSKHFIKMLKNYDSTLSRLKLKKAFDLFDKENAGKIKIDDLKQIFYLSKVMEKNDFEKEINNIINEVDKNSEHTINFNEFLYILIEII